MIKLPQLALVLLVEGVEHVQVAHKLSGQKKCMVYQL